MTNQNRKKLYSENLSGVLRVDVEPRKVGKKGKFGRFKDWLLGLFSRSNAEDYIDAADLYAREQLRRPAIENEKMERDIEFRKRQKEMMDFDLKKRALFTEYELDAMLADTEKTRAEAEAIRLESRLKAIEKLKKLGVDVLPVVKNGEVAGLYVSSNGQPKKKK